MVSDKTIHTLELVKTLKTIHIWTIPPPPPPHLPKLYIGFNTC